MSGLGDKLRRHGLRPEKSWGQNFLTDPGLLSAIAGALTVAVDTPVIELGAGPGTLTRHLLARGFRVIAVERDRRYVQMLEREFAGEPRLQVAAANAAAFALPELCASRCAIIGNLPYHLSTGILFHCLSFGRQVEQLVLLVQREQAARWLARPGTKEYGSPTVQLALLARGELVRKIPRGAFTPKPAVDGSLVRITPRQDGLPERARAADVEAVIRQAFGQRRKTLLKSLSSRWPEDGVRSAMELAKLPAKVRPEQVAPEIFLLLAEKLRLLSP